MGLKPYEFYRGDGEPGHPGALPPFQGDEESPSGYIPSPELVSAVNVALMLGQPLLLTGEPGTGKTQLAASVAHELGLPKLEFYTKTTSTARDLFYSYDALRHFHDAQFVRKPPPPESYISFGPLGEAIILSLSPDDARRRRVDDYLPKEHRGVGPTRSVVLIDEVDKAPRDLTNDVLNEVEKMAFEVRELKRSFEADEGSRPFIIMTSNSEKNLPEPFLRRCVFHHIEFPDGETLKKIIRRRLKLDGNSDGGVELAVNHFERLRGRAVKKRPATAELLWWVKVLARLGLLSRLGGGTLLSEGEVEEFKRTYSVLAKTKEDLRAMKEVPLPAALLNGQ